MTIRSVCIWLCVQGQLAELNLRCVGYNLLERSVLGEFIVCIIPNSTVAYVIHNYINFEEGGGGEQLI